MKKLWALALAVLLAAAAQAQTAPRKIAVTSLIGDQMTIATYRGATGTNLSNNANVVKVPNSALDLVVLERLPVAAEKATGGAAVFALKVPAAGSSTDPAQVYADGKVVPDNALVVALRQQGFTHLLTVTKLRHNNIIRLADGAVNAGRGQLEGLGFYLDGSIAVQNVATGVRSEGIIAPFAYVELRLVDLATLDYRSERVTVNTVVGAARNKEGTDAWGALTATEKFEALEGLIVKHVVGAVPALFSAK